MHMYIVIKLEIYALYMRDSTREKTFTDFSAPLRCQEAI